MFHCGQWEFVLVAVISLARIGMPQNAIKRIRETVKSQYNKITQLQLKVLKQEKYNFNEELSANIGPSLLYLANNVDTTVPTMSQIFFGKSAGIVLGALAGGVLTRRTGQSFRHLYPLGVGLLLLGTSCLLMPHLKVLWAVVVNITIGSVMYGYLDCGMQALLLQLFGETGSRAKIQLFHFGFSVGAFFGPMLAQPFLVLYDQLESSKSRCPKRYEDKNFASNSTTTPPNHSEISTSFVQSTSTYVHSEQERSDPMIVFYAIIGSWSIAAGLAMLALGKCDAEAKVSHRKENDTSTLETRAEEPFKDVIGLFLCVTAFYYCAVSTENVFYYYLYSVAICSDLKFSIEDATLVNSIMWLGLGVGRLTGTAVANYISPRNIILFAIAGSALDALLMSIFGETAAWLTWIVAFSHLFTTGMFYPAGVSWTAQSTNVSGTYQSVFTIGTSLGGMTMLPLAGFLFGLDPFNVIYQVFTLAVVNGLVFGISILVANKRVKPPRVPEESSVELMTAKPVICDNSSQPEQSKEVDMI